MAEQLSETVLGAQAAAILGFAIDEILIVLNGLPIFSGFPAFKYHQLAHGLDFEERKFELNNGVNDFEFDELTVRKIRLQPNNYPIHYRLLESLRFLSLNHLHWNMARAINQASNQQVHRISPRCQFGYILEQYAVTMDGEDREIFSRMLVELSALAKSSKAAAQLLRV
ncbi:hypothetical protein TWF506_009216 [Arthrobotrys conoides]|uniref:Uncharacterized protein n=1 Tax=Arthrobotrys conoides TaxID=74498 RepID=A0AAN8NN71_9PEZI